jgi:hypothetical protein
MLMFELLMLAGGGINNHLNGIIDELRIYNRGLIPGEIKILSSE